MRTSAHRNLWPKSGIPSKEHLGHHQISVSRLRKCAQADAVERLPADQVRAIFEAQSGQRIDIQETSFYSLHGGNPANAKHIGVYLGALGERNPTAERVEFNRFIDAGAWIWALHKENTKSWIKRDLVEREKQTDLYLRLLMLQRRFIETQNPGYSPFVFAQSFGTWHLWHIALRNIDLLHRIDHMVLVVPFFGLHPQDPLRLSEMFPGQWTREMYATWQEGMRALASLQTNFTFVVAGEDPVVDRERIATSYEMINPSRRRLVYLARTKHRVFLAQDNPDHLKAFIERLPIYFQWGDIRSSADSGILIAQGHDPLPFS